MVGVTVFKRESNVLGYGKSVDFLANIDERYVYAGFVLCSPESSYRKTV